MAVKRPAASAPSVGGGGGGGTTRRASRASSTPFIEAMQAAFRIPELRRRLIFVFMMFAVYCVGLHIPIAGVREDALKNVFNKPGGGGVLSLIDVFSGGALKQFTVFAMGIIPYINASIIMQLLTFAIPQWQELAREGDSGRKQIAKYTRYLAFALAILQGTGTTVYFNSMHVIDNTGLNPLEQILNKVGIVLTLAA